MVTANHRLVRTRYRAPHSRDVRQQDKKMNKQQILDEIHRLTKAAGGIAPGRRAFETETGIRESDWSGKYWVRWSDAVIEAGCMPNQKREAYSDAFLLERLATLVRKLGHYPVEAELRMKARSDTTFPNSKTLRRFGSKRQTVDKVREFCLANKAFADVVPMCPVLSAGRTTEPYSGSCAKQDLGFVYLIKHGTRREYKIGRTNNMLRREGEIGIELPGKIEPIHVIQTDDPAGIEAYWHRRFSDKRLRNEWFLLTADDVKAFKRWRKIS